MNAVLRAKAILIDPAAEWTRIAAESGDPVFLLSRYVALLALVPAVFGFIGACLIGVVAPGGGIVRTSLFNGLLGAIFGYVAAFATMIALGLLINIVAPTFGGRRSFDGAFKLAVYSYTPVWLVGVFLLLPGLRFLALSSFYGAYLLLIGLPRLMKSNGPKALPYAAVIVACACTLAYAAAHVQRAVFDTPAF